LKVDHNTASKKTDLRWSENLHILLWLIKDVCWAMAWPLGGMLMVVPTVSVAAYILYNSRGYRPDFYHNIAVCMWISANSIWMTGEFFNKEYRPIAVSFFAVGIAILIYYYIRFYKIDRKPKL
jgi:hypothetical protein